MLNFRELNKAGHAVADGTVLNVCEELSDQQSGSILNFRHYLADHVHHLNYAERLAEDRIICSEPVAGGRKQTGASSRVRRLIRQSGLHC